MGSFDGVRQYSRVVGPAIFPHNIGLGAANNPAHGLRTQEGAYIDSPIAVNLSICDRSRLWLKPKGYQNDKPSKEARTPKSGKSVFRTLGKHVASQLQLLAMRHSHYLDLNLTGLGGIHR